MTRDICCPTPLSFFPYQIEGIEFALGRDGTLLADEMGVGKTIQAIGLINALGFNSSHRILIVCPATMRLVWREELTRWLVSPLSIAVAGVDLVEEQILARVNVLIVNYERLEKMPGLLTGRIWNLAIFDECHFLKNPEAKRTRMALQIQASQRLALSGTPMPNRPIELYPILSWLDPKRWPALEKFNFAQRYCAAKNTAFGWNFDGASNLDELGTLLRSSVMLRRTKAEVLPQLPPKFRRVVEISPSTNMEKLVEAELAAFEEWLSVKEVPNSNGQQPSVAFKAGKWETLAQARHAVAIAKIPLVVEFIRESLKSSQTKIVLFAHHRDVIETLAALLSVFGPVILYGGMSATLKQTAIDRFQSDPATRIFIGNIQAAGLGLTLAPASSHCIFAELSWVPADLTQAEDRLHRVGTKDNVLVQHLVLKGSLDAIMVRRLIAKQQVLDGVFCSETSSERHS
jgi:SWI/SNF-related matrix-associated actin-dependent regulator 1 of chromatin subfamily A